MNLSVNVSELGSVINALDEAVSSIIPSVAGAVTQGVSLIEDDAKSLCPVNSGNLKASITSSVSASADSVQGIVAAGAPYAVCVEFGTLDRGARPFMQPAFDMNVDTIMQLISSAISKGVSG